MRSNTSNYRRDVGLCWQGCIRIRWMEAEAAATFAEVAGDTAPERQS